MAKYIAAGLQQVDSCRGMIRSGDLILRTGNDFASEIFRNVNQHDKTYSHCGIASIEHGEIYVYHALGGDFNPDQKLLRQPLAVFADPEGNRGIGIFHYELDSSDLDNIVATAQKIYLLGIPFDMQFNLQSNDRMYCAEFVYKTLRMGSHEKLHFSTSSYKGVDYISVDELFLQERCKKRTAIVYNKLEIPAK